MFTHSKILLFYIFNLFVFLLESFVVLGNSNKETYTGKLAKAGQFPFAIRLYSKVGENGVFYCTATIISSSKLLTAAHCCQAKAYRFVVSGDPDQTDFVNAQNKHKYIVHNVKKTIVHPNFERTESKLVHDLCLLILKEPLTLGEGYQAIPIEYKLIGNKKNCTALGWGVNFGHQLQHKLYYKEAIAYRCNLQFQGSVKQWYVCLEPHSVCPGDSGGPLVCDGKLYGIASFFIGQGDDPNPRCEEGVVDYYSELSAETEFIQENSMATATPTSFRLFLLLFLLNCKFL